MEESQLTGSSDGILNKTNYILHLTFKILILKICFFRIKYDNDKKKN